MESFPLRPRDITEALRKTVVGQDEGACEISVALIRPLVGHSAGNILLIGNSGTGKTTLMRAVEQHLAAHPDLSRYANIVRMNANVLAEERQGYGKAVLGRLYENAKRLLGPQATAEEVLHSVEHGIAFVDEVDQTRAQGTGHPN